MEPPTGALRIARESRGICASLAPVKDEEPMTPTRILIAAGCAALLGGTAASAQSNEMAVNPQNPSSQTEMQSGATVSEAEAKSEAAAQVGVDASALTPAADQAPGTVSTDLITNGPVPDTPENRARFGGPNSRSGQMTAPSGN